MGKVYSGRRMNGWTVVTVLPERNEDGYELEPRLDLANHSPTGFEWGYAGSGPSQLALALLCDALKGAFPPAAAEALALHHYQEFKFDRVALLPKEEDWRMSQGEILAWVEREEKGRLELAKGN